MSKKVAVLFSSGLDSTYLIWKNLKDGNVVRPLYIEIENNTVKSTIEKNRIELLYKEFYNEFGSKIYSITYPTKVNVLSCNDTLYFHQMPIWIFSILFCQCLDIDEIQIGYVSGDDAISYLDDIKNIYYSYQAISDKLIPLTFPLTKIKKEMMVKELPSQYLDLIFSCENAEIIGDETAKIIQYEPCCNCTPCQHIIANNYYGTGRFPDNYKKNLIKYHARALYFYDYNVNDENGKPFDFEDSSFLCSKKLEPHQLTIEFPPDLSQFKSPGIPFRMVDNCEKEKKEFLG